MCSLFAIKFTKRFYKPLHNRTKSVNFVHEILKLMNLTVALFLSEIKRCSCCLGVLDTPQFVSGVLLHTRLHQ